MRTQIIETTEGFQELEPQWNELFAQAAYANPFLSHQWLFAWWKAYRIEAMLCIIIITNDAGHCIGIAPLMIKREKRCGISYRVLYFVGDGTFETDHMGILLHRDLKAEATSTILDTIAGLSSWDVAHFNQISESSQLAQHMTEWCSRRRFVHSMNKVTCLIRNLPSSYEALLSQLQPRFRTKLRSTAKKLEEKYKIEFGLHDDPNDFDNALQSLFRNHASRWSAKGQAGVFVNQRKRDFYRHLTPAFFDAGFLRFFYLKLDGTIIAQEYCFAHDRRIYLLQEGFDYSYSKENIGNYLRSIVLKYCINQGLNTYDNLAGDSRNKRTWADTEEYDIRLEAVRPGFTNAAYFHVPKIAARGKEMIRHLLNFSPRKTTTGSEQQE